MKRRKKNLKSKKDRSAYTSRDLLMLTAIARGAKGKDRSLTGATSA